MSRNCFELDSNMNVIQKEPMRTGRFNTAISLMSDKLIFVIGGSISKERASDIVECFDTQANVWYPVTSLNRGRSGTSACSIGNRYIYLFPG